MDGYAHGGYVSDASGGNVAASNNTVNFTDNAAGTANYAGVYGGYARTYWGTGNATANGNIVNIGGSATATASHNIINISGNPTISGPLIAGEASSASAAIATYNTINISGNPTINGNMYGGSTSGGAPTRDARTGNTLNLLDTKNITAQGIQNFENFHFQLPAGIANGDTVLTAAAVFLGDNANVSLAFAGQPTSLQPSQKVILIRTIPMPGTLTGSLSSTTASTSWGASNYVFDLAIAANELPHLLAAALTRARRKPTPTGEPPVCPP